MSCERVHSRNTLPRVAVVIPFYQRSAGLLSRAIESIWAQQYQPEPLIIVVDDSSPMPADEELSNIPRHIATR